MYPYSPFALDGPLVRLSELASLCLIVEGASVVRYCAQVAGSYNLQKSVRGVLVPLESADPSPVLDALQSIFSGTITPEIDDACADRVDEILRNARTMEGFKVDRDRLHDSASSWIWIEFDAGRVDHGLPPLAGFPSGRGAIVWPNYG